MIVREDTGQAGIQTAVLILLVVAACSLVLCSGCGSGSPEGVVEKFINALSDGDETRAMTCCSEVFIFNRGIERFRADVPEDSYAEGKHLFARENLRTEYDNDKAQVWSKYRNYIVFNLIKERGNWRIKDVEVDTRDIEEFNPYFSTR